MPSCPYCGEAYGRRARGGRCPGCNRKVYLFEGGWYRNDLNGLPSELLESFEEHVAQKLKVPSFRIGVDGSSARMRELGRARQLIGDIDDPCIAMAAIDVVFSHPKLAWKDRLSLMQVSPQDWALATVLAKNIVLERQKREDVQQHAHNDILQTMKELGL